MLALEVGKMGVGAASMIVALWNPGPWGSLSADARWFFWLGGCYVVFCALSNLTRRPDTHPQEEPDHE